MGTTARDANRARALKIGRMLAMGLVVQWVTRAL
jgi:hypothetical protein